MADPEREDNGNDHLLQADVHYEHKAIRTEERGPLRSSGSARLMSRYQGWYFDGRRKESGTAVLTATENRCALCADCYITFVGTLRVDSD